MCIIRLLNSNQFNFFQVKPTAVVAPIKAIKANIKAITERLKRGATVSEVNDAFRAHEFPALEPIESQMALLKAVEESGQSAVVNQVLAEESTSDAPDMANVGFRALLTVLAVDETYNTDEIITNFQPKEMSPEVAQERFAQLVSQSKEITQETVEEQPPQEKVAIRQQEAPITAAEPTARPATQAAPPTSTAPKTVSPEPVLDAQEQNAQEQNAPQLIREGDIFFALATFVSETGEAMNLVEGERVHVLEWNNDDWWYVRKHLTEEAGWVPAQYLKDEQTYALYVQKKLVEKIEKLPVFDGEAN